MRPLIWVPNSNICMTLPPLLIPWQNDTLSSIDVIKHCMLLAICSLITITAPSTMVLKRMVVGLRIYQHDLQLLAKPLHSRKIICGLALLTGTSNIFDLYHFIRLASNEVEILRKMAVDVLLVILYRIFYKREGNHLANWLSKEGNQGCGLHIFPGWESPSRYKLCSV